MSVFGGLGNQMFQYSLGRNLSIKLSTDLKIDYSFNLIRTDFNSDDIPCIFDVFNIEALHASIEEIKEFKSLKDSINYRKIYFYLRNKYPDLFQSHYRFISESHYNFDAKVFNYSGHCYLYGYWQSEKYFIENETIIRDDFKFANPLTGTNFQVAHKIETSESVSIHLRGRDYITKAETNKVHFTCDNSYYNRCLDLISKRVSNPNFFVFSDDPIWAKDFLQVDYPCYYVEGNSWNKNSHEDMRLMSLCKHNIIANSSFSWWAAWLNKNPNKIVIAPEKWFNDSSKNTNDLIPNNWLKV